MDLFLITPAFLCLYQRLVEFRFFVYATLRLSCRDARSCVSTLSGLRASGREPGGEDGPESGTILV